MKQSIGDMISVALDKVHEVTEANTIMGQPVAVGDGVTVIPISRVRIGVGGGGSEFAPKSLPAGKDNPFGGGLGCGVNVDPVAFLIIRGESVRMLPVAEPASTTIDRLIEMAPEAIDKLADFLENRKGKKENQP